MNKHLLVILIMMGAWCGLVLLGGCETRRAVHDDPLMPPTSDMSKMKGADMPQAGGGPPMPAGWKGGFKAY